MTYAELLGYLYRLDNFDLTPTLAAEIAGFARPQGHAMRKPDIGPTVTVNEAATLLGVPLRSTYKALHRGELPGVFWFAGRLRVPVNICAVLRKRSAAPATRPRRSPAKHASRDATG